MTALNVEISVSLDQRFRDTVYQRKGLRKGAITEAVTEALKMWISSPTEPPCHVHSETDAVAEMPAEVRHSHFVSSQIQRLSEDPKTQERIKELWRGGERNRQAIAQQVGYKSRTVQQYIKDCLESGELER